MAEALQAYRHVAASDDFKEKERMRSKARHDEAQALMHRDIYWQGVVAEKDAENAELRTQLEALRIQLGK